VVVHGTVTCLLPLDIEFRSRSKVWRFERYSRCSVPRCECGRAWPRVPERAWCMRWSASTVSCWWEHDALQTRSDFWFDDTFQQKACWEVCASCIHGYHVSASRCVVFYVRFFVPRPQHTCGDDGWTDDESPAEWLFTRSEHRLSLGIPFA